MKRIACLIFLGLTACDAKMLGIPRIALSVKSPNGRYLALVRNHPTLDPPEQSIWLGGAQIERLGGDVDWCNKIVWSDDSSRVGYLIQDARLVVIDAKTARLISTRWLVPRDGYPTSHEARHLELTRHAVHYDDCVRDSAVCSPRDLALE